MRTILERLRGSVINECGGHDDYESNFDFDDGHVQYAICRKHKVQSSCHFVDEYEPIMPLVQGLLKQDDLVICRKVKATTKCGNDYDDWVPVRNVNIKI